MIKILAVLDKAFDSLGQAKTQKGFFITMITAAALQVFPDLPQEDLTKVFDYILILVNGFGQVWLSLGVIHSFVKNKMIKKAIIPPSIEKAAENGQIVLIVKPN